MHTVYLLVAVVVVVALDVVALAQVWRDPARDTLERLIWTVVIALVPVVGGVGWAINWAVGRAAARLGARG